MRAIVCEKRVSSTDAAAVVNIAKVHSRLMVLAGASVAHNLQRLSALDTYLDVLSVFPDDEKMARVSRYRRPDPSL